MAASIAARIQDEEERRAKIDELERKLDVLGEQKHKLFLLLKQVLFVDEKKRKKLAEEERNRLEEQRRYIRPPPPPPHRSSMDASTKALTRVACWQGGGDAPTDADEGAEGLRQGATKRRCARVCVCMCVRAV
jgi:hypothetical protein